MTKPKPPPTIQFPSKISIQIFESKSLWKKIVFIAQTKNWTPREVIEHAISVAYYLYEVESIGNNRPITDKRNF
jgi:hypothetical protein